MPFGGVGVADWGNERGEREGCALVFVVAVVEGEGDARSPRF